MKATSTAAVSISLAPGVMALGLYCCLSYSPVLAEVPADQPGQPALTGFSQKLGFNLPQGWKRASNETQVNMIQAEFVPQEQTLGSWSSMICVQSFKGLAAEVTAEQFLDRLAISYRDVCRGELVYQKLGETQVDGHPGFQAIMGCTELVLQSDAKLQPAPAEPRGEIGYYAAILGQVDLYLLHKSDRREVFNLRQVPLAATNYRDFVATIQPLSLK
ncbi:hypothetical protein LZP73_05040 [Shewanella sp. AS16]|uniref:hypothetical protein n=1 Tax=Shewanella sp. AS16 TaxID=2907625 RepID=UPI001F3196C7|nr:hypothetical protein [Shewanella sp. AS16]MCE9685580.1 hypothetical protein [Shewanella sp. AS16]